MACLIYPLYRLAAKCRLFHSNSRASFLWYSYKSLSLWSHCHANFSHWLKLGASFQSSGCVYIIYLLKMPLYCDTMPLRTPPFYGRPLMVPMIGHRNVYLPDLWNKDISLFRIKNAQSHPKRSYCIVNELYNTVKAFPRVRSLVLANQFHLDHHEDSQFTTSKHQILRYLSVRPPLSLLCHQSSFRDAGKCHFLRGVACDTMHALNQHPN